MATTATSSAQTTSPYTGEEQRAIKALSEEEIKDLLEARGMGLAKAAELNSYPGPLHVLQLAAEGLTSAAIGARLAIGKRTVETHRANLQRKLGLKTQADLVRFAVKKGVVSVD